MTPEPELSYPRIMLMITEKLVPTDAAEVTWCVGKAHPSVPDMKIMAMFVNDDFVEVYSVIDGNRGGMRDLIPTRRARILREGMPLDVFMEELARAELGYPDDDDDDLDVYDDPAGSSPTIPAKDDGHPAP